MKKWSGMVLGYLFMVTAYGYLLAGPSFIGGVGIICVLNIGTVSAHGAVTSGLYKDTADSKT